MFCSDTSDNFEYFDATDDCGHGFTQSGEDITVIPTAAVMETQHVQCDSGNLSNTSDDTNQTILHQKSYIEKSLHLCETSSIPEEKSVFCEKPIIMCPVATNIETVISVVSPSYSCNSNITRHSELLENRVENNNVQENQQGNNNELDNLCVKINQTFSESSNPIFSDKMIGHTQSVHVKDLCITNNSVSKTNQIDTFFPLSLETDNNENGFSTSLSSSETLWLPGLRVSEDKDSSENIVIKTERLLHPESIRLHHSENRFDEKETLVNHLQFIPKEDRLSSVIDNEVLVNKTLKKTSDTNDFVQFRNLDTGEIRLVSLDFLSSRSEEHASHLKTCAIEFAELFNPKAEQYTTLQNKLQKHLESHEDGSNSSLCSSKNSDTESSDSGLNVSETAVKKGRFTSLYNRIKNKGTQNVQIAKKLTTYSNSTTLSSIHSMIPMMTNGIRFRDRFIRTRHTSCIDTTPNNVHDISSVSEARYKTKTVSSLSTLSKNHLLSCNTLFDNQKVSSAQLNKYHHFELIKRKSIDSIVSLKEELSELDFTNESHIGSMPHDLPSITGQSRLWLSTLRRYTETPQHLPYQIQTKLSGGKEDKCLSDVWLIKEIRLSDSIPIWSLSISYDGLWLAAGIQDGTVRLWRILLPDHLTNNIQPADNLETNRMTSFETLDLVSPRGDISSDHWNVTDNTSFLFDDLPTITLMGHTATIVLCQWDTMTFPNGINRLASASLDRTVRVWSIHSTNSGPQFHSIVLHCADWATAVCFHPYSKDVLYTGALDGTVQVWRIPTTETILTQGGDNDSEIHHQACTSSITTDDTMLRIRYRRLEMLEFMRMTDLITAMSLSPNGKLLAVGLRLGRVSIYEARSLRFHTEVDCRNRKGQYSSGRKVTGLIWTADSLSLCVSTSDSRLRMISLHDVTNWNKFKGHTTHQMMLHAHFSPSEKHLICGSETSWMYVWNVFPMSPISSLVSTRLTLGKKKKPTNAQTEKFRVFNELLTASITGTQTISNHIISCILNLPTSSQWEQLQLTLQQHQINEETSSLSRTSLYGLIIIVGGYKGTIRVFINASHPIINST